MEVRCAVSISLFLEDSRLAHTRINSYSYSLDFEIIWPHRLLFDVNQLGLASLLDNDRFHGDFFS